MPAALLPVALHVKDCVSWSFKELDGTLSRSAGSSSQPSTLLGPFEKALLESPSAKPFYMVVKNVPLLYRKLLKKRMALREV